MEDEYFERQIAEMQVAQRNRRVHRDQLHKKFYAEQAEAARYIRLAENQEELEREIAEMEGRPYRENGDYGYSAPPEPPDCH
jgi:hypothetical protein